MPKVINNNENEQPITSNNGVQFRSLTNVDEQDVSNNSKSKILKELTQSCINVPKKKKYSSKNNLNKVLLDNKILSRLNLKKINKQIISSTHLVKGKNYLSLKSIEKDLQQKIVSISMKIEKESTIIGLPENSFLKLTTLIKEKIVEKDNKPISLFSPKQKRPQLQYQNSPVNKKKYENNNNGDNVDNNNANDSSSKKILSKLKVLKTLKNNKNIFRVLLRKNLIYDSFDSEEEEDLESIVISHGNTFIQVIDSLVMISSLFYMIYTPFYISNFKSICSPVAFICKYIYFSIDILYIIDLILGFFRAHHNHQFQIINKNSEVVKHYLITQFFLDLLQAIPFFSYIFFLQDKDKNIFSQCEYYNINSFHLFLILCCNIKYLKFFKVIDIKKNSIFLKIRQSISEDDNLEQIFIFLLYFILVIFGFYFFISIHILIGRSSYPNWINTFGFQDETLSSLYLISFYFIITTTTTVGYGNIVCASSIREIVFQLILLSVGITVYSWIVSNIGNYVKNESSASIRFDKDEAILEEIRILYPNISYNLYKKIFNHLGVRKIRQRQCDSSILINSLPHSLKTEIILSIHKKIIKNFKIFRGNQNTDFTVRLLTNFIPFFSKKNAYLIHEGQLINNIFFVKEGSLSLEACVDINDPYKSVKKYLKKNFGDIFEDAIIVSDYDEFLDTSKITKNNYNNLFKKAKSEINSLLNENTGEVNTSINESIIIKEIGKMDYGGEIFEESNDVQLINIINISKNENFGEVYLFLNKPSPLSLKVKSKKAELFLLRKSDASDISIRYPNIWSKFFKKSYLNMLSIKSLTIHKLKHYWKNIGKQIKKKCENKEKLFDFTASPKKCKSNITKTIVPKIEIAETNIEDKINDNNKILASDKNDSESSYKNKKTMKYISFGKDNSNKNVPFDKRYNSCFNENPLNNNLKSDFQNEPYKRNIHTCLSKNNIRLSKFNKNELTKFKKNSEENLNKAKTVRKIRIEYLNKLNRKIKQLKTSKNYYKNLWKELSFNNTHKSISNINNNNINDSIQSIKKKNSINISSKKTYKSDKINNINININFNNNNVILDKPEINITNSSSTNSNKSSYSYKFYNINYLAITSPINFSIEEKYKNLDTMTNGEYSKNFNLRMSIQNFINFYLSGFWINAKKEQMTEYNLSTISPVKNHCDLGIHTSSSVLSDRKKLNIPKMSEVSFCPSKKSSVCVNDGKILLVYDKFRNYFYLYGNNKDSKKRFSASGFKTFDINVNEPKIKTNLSSIKDIFNNQNSKSKDTLVDNNIKVNNFLFSNFINNTNKFNKTVET